MFKYIHNILCQDIAVPDGKTGHNNLMLTIRRLKKLLVEYNVSNMDVAAKIVSTSV